MGAAWRDRVIQAPRPTRLERAARVRSLHRRLLMDQETALRLLRKIYPRLTLTDAGWLTLLEAED